MRFSHVAVTALLSGFTVSGAPTTSDDTVIADLAKQAYDKTQEQLSQAQKRSSRDSSCSLSNRQPLLRLELRRDSTTSSPPTSIRPRPSTTQQTSSHGIGTSPGCTRRHCERSAASKATSHTGTGPRRLTVVCCPALYSMAAIPP